MTTLPLHKVLISSQITSRRKCTQAIKDGQVKVSNKVIKDPLFLVDCTKDIISIDGKRIDTRKIFKKDYVYYLLNKPKGFICTVKDTHKRKTVLDLVKDRRRIYPVGRLDKDTEGLLILTNDGDLTYRLTHPKFEINKTYEALVAGSVKKSDLKRLQEGVYIDKGVKVSARVQIIKVDKRLNQTKLKLIIHQGIKRQIRIMLSVLGYEVIHLVRTRIGMLEIGNLKKGQARRLSPKEVNSLNNLVGVKDV